jgi:asparagine synthase (glutamine-hydrolysing)
MCGIAGVVGPVDEAVLDRLAAALAHRGPDDCGVYRELHDGVALVSRRLAILDLAGGAQPMTSEDVTIAFNGEIFNAPALRAELERDGVRFATDHSDTEVVLRLYERDGERCVERLNGMFGFAIHDRRRGLVFGARDALGIKPLYLTQTAFGLAFASELRTLLLVPGVERTLDEESLYHYVSLRFVPGAPSIFSTVRRLPAGHRFRYRIGERRLEVERWWRLQFAPDRTMSRVDWLDAVREELRAAVDRWTLSDVPIACSLSGGLDSSAIVGLLAESGHSDLRTFTLGFASREDASLDELPLARALADRWGTRHHELVVDADELLDDLLAMVWALDEPYGGGLPSWYVFRAMAADVKVGLTGSGGDELFGNYRRFVPFEAGRAARFRRNAVGRYHFEPSYYFTTAEQRALLSNPPPGADTAHLLQTIFDENGSRSPRDGVLYLDTATQLPDEFLLMTDRFSMAHSLEARTPFLDRRFVDLVARIPPELRTSPTDPKGLLRDAVADLLTAEHLGTPKRTFVFPLARWLRQELRPLAERMLGAERLARQGLFRPEAVATMLQAHLAGRSDETERLWPLLMFQLWHLLFVEEALSAPPAFGWRDVA